MRNSILVNMPNYFLLNFVKSQMHKNSNAAKSINFMFFRIDKNLMTIDLPWYEEHD